MNESPLVIAAGIACGLGAAFSQALSYFFSRRFLTECHTGSRMLFSISLVQMGVVSLLALPFLLDRELPPLAEYAWPLLGVSFFFLAAQWILFSLLKTTDSSVVAPMLGLKIPILGALSMIFFGETISGWAWLAILMCTVAAFLVSPPRGLPEIRVLLVILGICLLYSGSDLNIPILVDRLQSASSYPALLGVSLTYVLCGGLGLLLALRQGAFRVECGQRYAAPYSLCWLLGMCFLFVAFSLIGVIFGNMLQSSRGFIAVLVGVAVSRAGLDHIETRILPRSWLVRGLGAVLMSAAIVLYYATRLA